MLKNYILNTCNAPGTGTCSLIAAPIGRRNFSDAGNFTTGTQCFIVLDDGVQMEWGIGTLTTGSPDTITRTTVLGNSLGTTAKLNFAGVTRVYNALPAENTIYKNSAGIVTAGLVTLTEPSSGTSTLTLVGTSVSGINIKMTGNGASTPNKYLRVVNGGFQIVNSAYTAIPFQMTDAGSVILTGTLACGSITAPSVMVSTVSNGQIQMQAGDTTHTGYLSLFNAGGTRQGYVGFGVGSSYIDLFNDSGTIGYKCNKDVAALTFTTTSDSRAKLEITSQPNTGLSRVLALRPVTYRWRDNANKDLREGLIAQEILPVIPSAVSGDPTSASLMGLDTMPLISVIIKAVQELSALVTHQAAAITALTAQVAKLEAKHV